MAAYRHWAGDLPANSYSCSSGRILSIAPYNNIRRVMGQCGWGGVWQAWSAMGSVIIELLAPWPRRRVLAAATHDYNVLLQALFAWRTWYMHLHEGYFGGGYTISVLVGDDVSNACIILELIINSQMSNGSTIYNKLVYRDHRVALLNMV